MYRCYAADGELLYVGASIDPKQRWRAHQKSGATWVDLVERTEITWFSDELDARETEAATIERDRPTYNRRRGLIPSGERPRRYTRSALGLTLPEYNALMGVHDGLCDVCRTPPSNRTGELRPDNCPQTGRLRGLLCTPCARAITLLGGAAESVNRAVHYLARREANDQELPTDSASALLDGSAS